METMKSQTISSVALGSNETRLSQIQKEHWVVISSYASLSK